MKSRGIKLHHITKLEGQFKRRDILQKNLKTMNKKADKHVGTQSSPAPFAPLHPSQ